MTKQSKEAEPKEVFIDVYEDASSWPDPKKRLIKYVAFTFVIGWILWGIRAALLMTGSLAETSIPSIVLLVAGFFAPTIAAIAVLPDGPSAEAIKDLFFNHRSGRTGDWVLLYAVLLVMVMWLSSGIFVEGLTATSLIIVFLCALILCGGNEEPGWRGIMAPIVESKNPFSVAALLVGIAEAVFYLPFALTGGLSFSIDAISLSLTYPELAGMVIFFGYMLGAIRKITGSVFYTAILRALTIVSMCIFVFQANITLVICLVVVAGISAFAYNRAVPKE